MEIIVIVHPTAGTSASKITRNSARRNRHKKQANHQKNAQIRSNLYREHAGSANWQRSVSEWHQTLKALSLGTA